MDKIKKFGWIIFALIIVINLAFFPFLPERLAIQFNSGGVSRSAAKPLALGIFPLVMLIINLVYGNNENKKPLIIHIGVIIFVINLVANIVNLIIAK